MHHSFSQHSNYSLYAAKNRLCLTDDFLLISRFHCEHHRYWRKQIVPPLSPLLQNPRASSYSSALPSRIYSLPCPQISEILVLFSNSLVAGSFWNNVLIYCNCSNGCLHLVLPCNSSWIVLGLDTLSSHVLADCIPNSVPADWPCNWNPLCCTSIWVVLGLDSLFLRVLECYTDNRYSVHWLCNLNPPQTSNTYSADTLHAH